MSSVMVVRGGGLKKVVIAALTGLPLSSVLLTEAAAAPAAVAPKVEASVATAPPAAAAPAAGPEANAPAALPETEAAVAQHAVAEPAVAEAPVVATPVAEAPAAESPAAEGPATEFPSEEFSELPPEPVPRDSIFDAGRGTHGDVTVAIGGLLDAVDPRSAAGASLRVPQLTVDARFGLGKGWSGLAHVNTVLGINEFGIGASWSFPLIGEIRGVAQFQAGAFVGLLGSFGFESTVVAPEFRPLVGLSLPIGTMRWSLRAEVVFAGPYFATLGDVSNTFATPPPVANWNVGLMMENLMRNNHLWYAGLIFMASTASYQNWLLFPDTANYDHYPRVMVGYEF